MVKLLSKRLKFSALPTPIGRAEPYGLAYRTKDRQGFLPPARTAHKRKGMPYYERKKNRSGAVVSALVSGRQSRPLECQRYEKHNAARRQCQGMLKGFVTA